MNSYLSKATAFKGANWSARWRVNARPIPAATLSMAIFARLAAIRTGPAPIHRANGMTLGRNALMFGLLVSLSSDPASAANLSIEVTKTGEEIIALNGQISEGDAAIFVRLVRESIRNARPIVTISLNSPGGAVLEASKLSDEIRSRGITTLVDEDNECASACFFAFAAGRTKIATEMSRIGIHRISLSGGEENAVTIMDSAHAEETLANKMHVPIEIVHKLTNTPPEAIYWLSSDELRSMGTIINNAFPGQN